MSHQQFNEGMEMGDLHRLVHPELHIDEFRSKLGKDEDVCVISFKIGGKEPADDLVNFCEKGYSWVIDADASSGEMDDGDYIVFVELERNSEVPAQVMELMNDLMNLTEQEISEWRLRYQTDQTDYDLSEEGIRSIVPLSADEYNKKFDRKRDIDKLKAVSGVEVTTKAPKNDFTEGLRALAGIR